MTEPLLSVTVEEIRKHAREYARLAGVWERDGSRTRATILGGAVDLLRRAARTLEREQRASAIRRQQADRSLPKRPSLPPPPRLACGPALVARLRCCDRRVVDGHAHGCAQSPTAAIGRSFQDLMQGT